MHDTDDIEAVMRYHERTKHHFDRYAPGPGELDWANSRIRSVATKAHRWSACRCSELLTPHLLPNRSG